MVRSHHPRRLHNSGVRGIRHRAHCGLQGIPHAVRLAPIRRGATAGRAPVKLTEEQFGPEELPLTNPLTNLATVYYKLGKYPEAIENYQRTLRILQAKSTISDTQQIRPLHGLGISFLGNNDPESAVVALKRAADLSRNTSGLYNINQVEFIDPLIDAYASTARYLEAEKEALYAMRVEEAAYGRNSIKLLPGSTSSRAGMNTIAAIRASATLDRALSILSRNAPPNDLRRVVPLRGIARSYRLEQFYGAEGADSGGTFNTGTNGAQVTRKVRSSGAARAR